MRARLLRWLAMALLVFLLAAVALAWLLGRETTLQYVVGELVARSNGEITLLGAKGGLYDGIAFDRLVIRKPTQVITLEEGVLAWRPAMLLSRKAYVTEARVKKILVEILSVSSEPALEPATLEMPIAFEMPVGRVDEIEIRRPGAAPMRFTALSLAASHDGLPGARQWRVEGLRVGTPWGAVAGRLQLGAQRPFTVTAEAAVSQETGAMPYRIAGKLQGPLAELTASAEFTLHRHGAPVSGTGSVRLAPFRAQPVLGATLAVPSISPRAFDPAWPAAALGLNAVVEPAGTAGFRGRVRVANQSPGTLDQGRLPVAALNADFTGDENDIVLTELLLDLGRGGQIRGKGAWSAEGRKTSLALRTENLDLAGIHGKLRRTAIRGDVTVAPGDGIVRIAGNLADAGLGLRVDATASDKELRVARAELRAGGGLLSLTGHMALAGVREFSAAGRLSKFDPARLGGYPAADLNADLEFTGAAGAPWRVAADLKFQPSRFMGRPLSGRASLIASADTLRNVDVALSLGANRVQASGGFALKGGVGAEKLVWKVDAPQLAELSGDFAGSLAAQGDLAGTLATPLINLDLDGRDLKLFGQHRIKRLTARARAEAGRNGMADAVVNAEASLTDYSSGTFSLSNARAAVAGNRAAHNVKLSARNADFDLDTAAAGTLDGANLWRGQVTSFDNRGRVPFRLQAPVDAVLGVARVELGPATIELSGGRLNLARFRMADGEIASRGNASGLPLALAVSFSESLKKNFDTNLRLGANWDFNAGGPRETGGTAATLRASGKLRVFRESGDVTFLTEPRFTAGLSRLEIDAEVADNRVAASLIARGEQLGSIQGNVSTRAERRGNVWGIPASAPLELKGDVDVPSLRWVTRLAGQPGLALDGHLRVGVTGTGTFGSPRLAGEASGSGIAFAWPDQGINYRGGEFEAVFNQDALTVKRLTLAAGEGSLSAQGELNISGVKTSGTLSARLDRFEAVSRPDRVVVASGEGKAVLDENRVTLTADLRANRGFFELPEKSEVTISDDIVIVGRAGEGEKKESRMTTRVDLAIDMGEEFRVRGAGLNGRLAGSLRVVSEGVGLPRAVGSLRIEEGIYTVYGQKLVVERGILAFSGPVYNPGLNLLAVRKTEQPGVGVEAGVEVRGTASAPQARLVSTPNVSETEKLSWLVLGRGLENSSQSDFSLLSAAASGLLGSSQGATLQARIASTLGVDEFGISPPGAGKAGLLSLGKRLSSRLFATYEQGLGKVSNLLKIRYTLSTRWAVQVQTGTESAVDALYTISFD